MLTPKLSPRHVIGPLHRMALWLVKGSSQ